MLRTSGGPMLRTSGGPVIRTSGGPLPVITETRPVPPNQGPIGLVLKNRNIYQSRVLKPIHPAKQRTNFQSFGIQNKIISIILAIIRAIIIAIIKATTITIQTS